MGLFTVGLRDDDFEPAYKFPARSTSLMVLGSSPVALLSACEDSGRPWSLRKLIDAAGFVPQHRERTYIVGFREENGFTFDDVKPIAHGNVGSILLPASQVPDKYVLSDKLWTYLQNYKKKHEAAGNGFGYGMVDAATDHTRTLSARYGKDGSEILVSRGEGKNPRRLTPRECARLMGYPDSFSIPVSDTQAYRQFGNSVAVPVIRAIGEAMKPYLSD